MYYLNLLLGDDPDWLAGCLAVCSLAEQLDGWLIDLLVLQLGVMFCLDLVLFLWIPMAIHMIPDEVTTHPTHCLTLSPCCPLPVKCSLAHPLLPYSLTTDTLCCPTPAVTTISKMTPSLSHSPASHTHTITLSHTLLITCTCCYDEIKGTKDQGFSY